MKGLDAKKKVAKTATKDKKHGDHIPSYMKKEGVSVISTADIKKTK
ncbi:MAG: hypothetical protein RR061_00510 [Muribaculaceae bacterium]